MTKQTIITLSLFAVLCTGAVACSPSQEQQTGKTLSGVGNLYKASVNEVDKNWETADTSDKKKDETANTTK